MFGACDVSNTQYDRALAVPASSSTSISTFVVMCFVLRVPRGAFPATGAAVHRPDLLAPLPFARSLEAAEDRVGEQLDEAVDVAGVDHLAVAVHQGADLVLRVQGAPLESSTGRSPFTVQRRICRYCG